MYMGSADLMPRNLDRRVEVLVPILDASLRERIRSILELQLSDNQQAWKLTVSGDYERLAPGEGELPINSQDILADNTSGD